MLRRCNLCLAIVLLALCYPPRPARAAPAAPWAAATPAPLLDTGAARLARFPRPADDNGWGIHWAPSLFAESTDVVDRFVAQVAALGFKWVKIVQQDQAKVEHEYLIRSLVKHGIMPVLRVYRATNTPYQHVGELARQAVPLGVYYFELYNEPNVTGEPGGWSGGEAPDPERIADIWLPAAQAVVAAGGFPGVPAPAPGGDYDDVRFLRTFLKSVLRAGGRQVLASSWLALHNYFLNHPVDYPQDPVNLRSVPLSDQEIRERRLSAADAAAINHARAISRLPRSQGGYYVGDTIDLDSNGFHKFEAYNQVAVAEVGFSLPIISTEGGVIPGTQEDPRYPRTSAADVAGRTTTALSYMVEQAPAYYFAFMPWLLANQAAGGRDANWEGAAWFYGPAGQEQPVVAAVRKLAGGQARAHTPANAPAAPPAPGAPVATPTPPGPAPAPGPGAATPQPLARPAAANQVYVIAWRDGEAVNCLQGDLATLASGVRSWRPPFDGRDWALEVRSASGERLGGYGNPGPLGPLPRICNYVDAAAAATPSPTPAPTPTATPTREWDRRLDLLHITVDPAPADAAVYWRLVSATFEDGTESGGRHHIYVRLLDENGQDASGTVVVFWSTGSYRLRTQPKQETDPYARFSVNFPMYGPVGGYSARVDGDSDTIVGLGLPGKQHVNYLLTFQRTRC